MSFAFDRRGLLIVAGVVTVALAGQYATVPILQLILRGRPRFVDFLLFTAIVQMTLTVVLPYLLAWRFLRLPPPALGVTSRNLRRGLALGAGLYAIALLVFISFCSADPGIADHLVRRFDGEKLFILTGSMLLIAAATDLSTRGFILLTLARHTPVWFAVLMQNAFWLWGHRAEIVKLAGPECLGMPGAIGLFLMLGILGDVIALRTRNVVGLAVGHMLLNLAMNLYIRSL